MQKTLPIELLSERAWTYCLVSALETFTLAIVVLDSILLHCYSSEGEACLEVS